MDKLTILAKHHKDWVRIVNSFGEYFLADDIVQETYIKIIRLNHIDKIVTETINKSMMWLVLRSVYIDHIRSLKNTYVSTDQCLELQSSGHDLQKDEAFSLIESKIQKEMNQWHHYDKMLFNLYRESKLSMREIADATKIHYTSIFHTLKRCKKRLQEAVGEDYQDYINQDFELIK